MGSSITIHREQIQDFRELKVTGRLDSGTTPQLSQALEEEVKAGHNRVMLNLLEVEFLSSAAIRVLLQYYKECRKRQGFLVVQPSAAVRSTLTMVGMTDLFSSPARINKKVVDIDI